MIVIPRELPEGMVIVLGTDTGAHAGATVGVLHPIPFAPSAKVLADHPIGRWPWTTAELRRESKLTGRKLTPTVKQGAMYPAIMASRACSERLEEFASAGVSTVFCRVEHSWVKDKRDGGAGARGALGPQATAGIWLALSSPAYAYEFPDPAVWRKHFGWKGKRDKVKALAMAHARILFGSEDFTEHEAEALAMALVPPSLEHIG